MNILHEKSPCCRGKVERYGGRRRRCIACSKTWRVWQKKRGRRKKRESPTLVIRYLDHHLPSLYGLARLRGVSEDSLNARLVRSRDLFLRQTPWPEIPLGGPLILLADGMLQYLKGEFVTAYVMLLRPVQGTEATMLPPFIRKGTERIPGWYEALGTIPPSVQNRIQAIVCDGHRGLVTYAKWSGWKIQRCHYHLLARIQGRTSRWHTSRSRALGEQLYQLVTHVLTTRDETSIMPTISAIEEIAWDASSRELRQALRGFVNDFGDYRTYLIHPELNLPTTNNAVESLNALFAALCHRARGFSSIDSFTKWLHALLKHRKTITCNGKRQPN